MILDRGIVYAPDFLINAGGLINCYSELEGYNRDRAMQQSQEIYDTTMSVLNASSEKSVHSQMIAIQMAEDRISKMSEIHRSL